MQLNIIVTLIAIALLCCGGSSSADSDELLLGIAEEQAQLGEQLDRVIEQQLQPKLELAMETTFEDEYLAEVPQVVFFVEPLSRRPHARTETTSPASNSEFGSEPPAHLSRPTGG